MTKTCEAVFPIKVLEQTGSEITINRGSQSGIRVGQVYSVYAAGKELTEPDTGAILGRQEVTVGRVVITELHKDFSKARVREHKGINAGAVLRKVAGNAD